MHSPNRFKRSLLLAGIALVIGSGVTLATSAPTFAKTQVLPTPSAIPSPTPPPPTVGPTAPPVVSPPSAFANPYLFKTCDDRQATAGQDVTFTVVAGNNGQTAAVNVQVRDTLPAYTSLKSVTAAPRGKVITSGNSFIVDIGTLAVSEKITIKVVGTLSDNATPGAGVNVATLNTTSMGDNPSDDISMCTYTIGAIVSPPTGAETDADLSSVALLMLATGVLLILTSVIGRRVYGGR